MNDHRRTFWTERVGRELEPGESVRAVLLAREPTKVSGGDVAEGVLAVATADALGPTPDVGTPARHLVIAATDRRVLAWRIDGEELVAQVVDWPLERARLKLERGLFGSRIRAGHQQVWMLSPLGGRAEAKALLAAAARQ